MIRIVFEGWFQCRLATDPDPWDEPRGVSGWTFAFPGEPDLDRVIRFHDPVAVRSHGPQIGVRVTKVLAGGQEQPSHPLAGASVRLLDDAVFEGRNGTIAPSAREPIVPFDVEITAHAGGGDGGYGGARLRLRRRDELDLGDRSAMRRRQPVRFEPNSSEVASATGISDFRQYRRDRRTALAADLAREQDPLLRFALEARIAQIDESDAGGIQQDSLGFLVGYRHAVAGPATVDDLGQVLGGAVDTTAPWSADFWMGGWDADALCGYVSGTLEVPVVAGGGSPTAPGQ